MNDKITFPRLASLLADRSGRSKRFSEDFLRGFFTLISETLESGESVKVKGLGTFKLSRVEPRRSVDVTTGEPMEISGHSKVVFLPSKELAEAVNAPFEAFTAIEIADNVDLSQLFALDENLPQDSPTESDADEEEEDSNSELNLDEEIPITAAEPETPETADQQAPETAAAENDMTQADAPAPDDHNQESAPTPDDQNQEAAPEPDNESEEAEEEREEETSPPEPAQEPTEDDFEAEETPKKNWRKIFLISFSAAMIALLAILTVWYVYYKDDFTLIFKRTTTAQTITPNGTNPAGKASSETAATIPTLPTDSIDSSRETAAEDAPSVPTAPSDALVYDTIGTTRYLTTMAKAHYGNYNLWPYIYEENKAILGHPDRIRPGTPVVIPDLKKYGVDPTKEEDIEKAKQMGVEIYARYGKKI